MTQGYTVDPGVQQALEGFELPEPLGFGRRQAPVMYRADYENGRWESRCLVPYGPIAVDPAAKLLHYAQSVFEGLKAYWVAQERPVIFRPDRNWHRINASLERMLMPTLPEEVFMEGLEAVTRHCASLMPRRPGQALYLRPVVFGTQAALGLGPSQTYTFLVLACPCEALTSKPLRALVEREGTRAAPGGTGDVKVSGNYGASLHATARAVEHGYDQPLWLDAVHHRYVEELSVMNFFAVIEGDLHTPALSGTILPGVTRASIIELARDRGLTVHERGMDVNELLADIRARRCTEAFACGTAVVVAPISTIGERDGESCELEQAPGPVAQALHGALLDVQEGRDEDRFGWMRAVL